MVPPRPAARSETIAVIIRPHPEVVAKSLRPKFADKVEDDLRRLPNIAKGGGGFAVKLGKESRKPGISDRDGFGGFTVKCHLNAS
jgi:hypothetical protein